MPGPVGDAGRREQASVGRGAGRAPPRWSGRGTYALSGPAEAGDHTLRPRGACGGRQGGGILEVFAIL